MRTFLTGGTGFIGNALLKRLLALGREVVALVRRPEDAHRLQAQGATPVMGDLLDQEALARAMEGCRVVYHVAGLNRFCLRDPSPLYRINVEGTRNVLHAALKQGVSRVIYTSSAAAIGEPKGVIAHEETPHRGFFLSHYERSKYQAEQVAFSFARQGLPVVVVSPSSVQGPGRLHGTARLILDYLNGRLPVIFGTYVSFVYIDDCVEAHVRAEERGRVGERYLVSGATLPVQEALAIVAECTGLDQIPRRLPAPLALALGAGAEAFARLFGRAPKLCLEQVRTMLHGHRYESSKAVRELGLAFTPPGEAIARTIRWYVEAGHVTPTRPLPLQGGG